MAFALVRAIRPATRPVTCARVRPVMVQQRSFRMSAVQFGGDHGHGHGHAKDVNEENGANARAAKMKEPLPSDLAELDRRFDEIFKVAPEDEDRGAERFERLTRQKMKRVARYQGDFSSLEEHHVLHGDRGTPIKPVIVESIYPMRTVGCTGSHETLQHDLLWHNVKREKPLVCLECGQTFQLKTPEGEQIYDQYADSAHH